MRRRNLLVNKKSDGEFVDLGLPSGLKWAKGNLKKSGNTCVIGEETDYGDFWSWANVGLTNDTGWMDSAGGVMTENVYNTTVGAKQTTDISKTDAAHDVAYKYLMSPWRLPTEAEFFELANNTDQERTIIKGIEGCKFMKSTDHSVYIFFPMSGYCDERGLIGRSMYSVCWGSTYSEYEDIGISEGCVLIAEYYKDYLSVGGQTRYYGNSIRPVQ